VEFAADTPMGQMGFHTYGGTAVSTQHHHIDPWGAMLAADFLRLAEATGKARWRELAIATWRQSLEGMSDGVTIREGWERPAGSQYEGYFHTRWGGEPGYAPIQAKGQVSVWLVCWMGAFRLLTLMRIGDPELPA
jgi:hypothetical protein